MKTVFLAWQDEKSRQWFPIGRLTHEDEAFEFVYVRGFENAHRRAALRPLPAFPDPSRVYRAKVLFPMFNNRIMSSAREEFRAYLRRLNLDDEAPEPLLILARSQGRRSTDTFEVFPFPLEPKSGRLVIDFFVHGLRHRSEAAQALAASLEPGAALTLRHDATNADDPNAVQVLAEGTALGFVPRYYAPDLVRLLARAVKIDLAVAKVNPSPAPVQQRVLCHLDAPWPFDAPPFEREDFAIMADTARLAS